MQPLLLVSAPGQTQTEQWPDSARGETRGSTECGRYSDRVVRAVTRRIAETSARVARPWSEVDGRSRAPCPEPSEKHPEQRPNTPVARARDTTIRSRRQNPEPACRAIN